MALSTDELADIQAAALQEMDGTCDIDLPILADDGRGGSSISSLQRVATAVPCLYQSRLSAHDLQLIAGKPANKMRATLLLAYYTTIRMECQLTIHSPFFTGSATILNVEYDTDQAALHLLVEHEGPI